MKGFQRVKRLCLCLIVLSSIASVDAGAAGHSGTSLKLTDSRIDLTLAKTTNARFTKADNGRWSIGSFGVWDRKARKWDEAYTSLHGSFLYMAKTLDLDKRNDACLYADGYEQIEQAGVRGVRFHGQTDLSGAKFTWAASYFFDAKDSLPLLHCEVTYSVDRDIELGYSPKVVTRTTAADASNQSTMSHIISYESSDKPVLIDHGYPLVWLNSTIGGRLHNCLLIDDVPHDSPEGRFFVYNRSPKAPHFTYWSIGSMAKDQSEWGTYYWNYRNPATGLYPEETALHANKTYKLTCGSIFGLDHTNLEFYRKYWAQAFDSVCPMDTVPFWSKDWDGCARGEIKEFKDDDKNAGDRYVDGIGYYSAPKKDGMSHGPGNVCWHGTAEIIHAMLYYTWATGDKADFDFYAKRLANANLPKWAANSGKNKGWINDFWVPGAGYVSWCSMWTAFDFGAYNLYNCYKLTGDKTYWKLFKGTIDYARTDLMKERNTLGEHWNDRDEQWYYLTPESSFTKAEKIEKGQDPGDYPGSLSVYAYLCLLTYNETKDKTYEQSAFSYIDHINTFLSHPQNFWTLCRVPKSNGMAFACLANVKRYELTKDKRFLDYAEEWAYLLMTMYHLRNEGHEDMGLAHASALGVFDYVCVSSLETIEPMYLMANLLKYRVNPTFLKYLALADRRHLVAYPRTHVGEKFDYEYIPMELIPQRASFAMYMAGGIMIENVMLHGLHSSSDPEITVICLDAAETGLRIKTSRNMLAYNPTSKDRKFTLKLKGLNEGLYTVTLGKNAPTQITAAALVHDGIGMELDAGKWVRITIEQATDR